MNGTVFADRSHTAVMKVQLIVSLLLSVCAVAHAEATLDKEEQRWARLNEHRARLEAQLSAVTDRTQRLKSQPSSIGRDQQLQRALREAQQIGESLNALQERIATAGRKLIDKYDRAITEATTDAERAGLARRQQALRRKMEPKDQRIVVTAPIEESESASQLDLKADLLLDSDDKIRNELRRVESRLARLERQSSLLRHSAAADDDLFVETLPQRVGSTIAVNPGPRGTPPASTNPTPSAGAPAEPVDSNVAREGAPPGSLAADSPNGNYSIPPPPAPDSSGGIGAGPTVSLREVVDPMTFESMQTAGKSANLKDQIAALREAKAKLHRLSGQLRERSKQLRREAAKRRSSTK